MVVSKLSCDLELSVLECQICFELIKTPIKMCSKGHSNVCNNCLKKDDFKCPTCQSNMTQMRNFLVEEMVNTMTIRCHQCLVDVKYGQFETHSGSASCKKRVVELEAASSSMASLLVSKAKSKVQASTVTSTTTKSSAAGKKKPDGVEDNKTIKCWYCKIEMKQNFFFDSHIKSCRSSEVEILEI